MIRTIEVKGYRALRYCRVDLADFLMLVGPNASGKSTFFDTLAFVRDVLQVGLAKAVFGDSRTNLPMRADDPNDLSWLRKGENIEIAVTADLPSALIDEASSWRQIRYEVAINVQPLSFAHENLFLVPQEKNEPGRQVGIFPDEGNNPIEPVIHVTAKKNWRKVVSKKAENGNDYFMSEKTKWNNLFRLGPEKSALANLPEDIDKFPAATWFKKFMMEGIHRLNLNAEEMRLAARAGSPPDPDLLPDGSNIPWVVESLELRHPERLRQWTDHVRTALGDVAKISTRERQDNRSRYLVLTYENGLEAPSWLLSDGTLRLLALTLIAYMPNKPGLLLIEEPENGIHPRAVETVIQSLSSVWDSQVFCATHSPLVLSLVEDTGALLCFGKTSSGAVDIVRGTDHPRLREWKKSANLGDMFAVGVLG